MNKHIKALTRREATYKQQVKYTTIGVGATVGGVAGWGIAPTIKFNKFALVILGASALGYGAYRFAKPQFDHVAQKRMNLYEKQQREELYAFFYDRMKYLLEVHEQAKKLNEQFLVYDLNNLSLAELLYLKDIFEAWKQDKSKIETLINSQALSVLMNKMPYFKQMILVS